MTIERNEREDQGVDRRRLGKAAVARFAPAFLVLGAVFFGTAGTLSYWQAWAYIGVLLVPMTFILAYLIRRDPALLERRLRTKEKKKEQGFIVGFSSVSMLAALILPGLDRRLGWSSVPPAVVVAALIVVLAGYGLIARVFKENSYASRIVEVASSQRVIDTGPYRVVRHPMYVGVILMYVVTPLALGSVWAVLPAFGIVPGIVMRIRSEEKALAAELAGYRDYLEQVRFRLIPGVW